ncbi:MAG TPA: ankyrin repeat domain-containing protein [Novosphingobium sp.]
MLSLALALTLAAAVPADPQLSAAIAADDVDGAEAALAAGADANALLDFGETPLARAVEAQDADLVAALLRHGARADGADASGLTSLALACERGGAAIVRQLLDAGADPHRPGAEGAAPLALCARFAPAETVSWLLARGAPADRPDPRGQTPLMWAAAAGRAEAVRLLLAAGARVGRVAKGGFTPLFFGIAGGNPEVARALIGAGADTAWRGPENTSALQLALYQKNWPVALLLVERDGGHLPPVDLAAVDRTGNRPLHVAAAAGEQELVAALLRAGADPNGLTGPSRIRWVTEANFGVAPPRVPPLSPLLVAAQAGQAGTMRQLVAAGADRSFVAANGTNVVLAAAAGRRAEALAYALELVPDANRADATGATPLHRVLAGGLYPGLEPMLRLLAAHGARTDLPDAKGVTAGKLAEDGLGPVRNLFHQVFLRAQAAGAVAGAITGAR